MKNNSMAVSKKCVGIFFSLVRAEEIFRFSFSLMTFPLAVNIFLYEILMSHSSKKLFSFSRNYDTNGAARFSSLIMNILSFFDA
jgi:hypothetical protein